MESELMKKYRWVEADFSIKFIIYAMRRIVRSEMSRRIVRAELQMDYELLLSGHILTRSCANFLQL